LWTGTFIQDHPFHPERCTAHVVQRLRLLPLAVRRGDVRPALFVGAYGSFKTF
jgi:hypothetical protein